MYRKQKQETLRSVVVGLVCPNLVLSWKFKLFRGIFRVSMMQVFAKIVYEFYPLNIFDKNGIIDVHLDSKYSSAFTFKAFQTLSYFTSINS